MLDNYVGCSTYLGLLQAATAQLSNDVTDACTAEIDSSEETETSGIIETNLEESHDLKDSFFGSGRL